MERKPDAIYRFGNSTVRVFGPGPLSDEERERRRKEVAKAVVRCLLSQRRQNKE
ncbi:hypothetical protein GCM10025857_14540 [Alicyclobacillus contaminans]|nr:hypothetical protein GCM10025857_14540 [Alicyclobacillus contaminans]